MLCNYNNCKKRESFECIICSQNMELDKEDMIINCLEIKSKNNLTINIKSMFNIILKKAKKEV